MLLNLTGMLKAPVRKLNFEVTMRRCHTANEYQNSRKRIAYVMAASPAEAKAEAKLLHP